MPELTIQSRNTRAQVTPAANTPNLKVAARPTDPLVTPGRSPDTAALLDTLSNLNSVTDGYINFQRNLKDKNSKKAVADATMGLPPEPPEGLFNMGYGYKEAYNVTMGEARGLEYHKELLLKAKENNYFQNEPNPEQAWDKFRKDLYKHHFGSVENNPELMFGASEQMRAANVAAEVEFKNASYNTAKTAFSNAVSSSQQDLLFVYANSQQSEADLGRLRRMLSEGWELNVKPTNYMTRDEYSTMIVNNIGTASLQIAQDPSRPTSEALAAAHKLASLFDAPDPHNGQSWSSMVDAGGQLKFGKETAYFLKRLNDAEHQREAEDAASLKQYRDDEEKNLFASVVINPRLPLAEKKAAILAANYLSANQVEDLIGKAEIYHKEEKSIMEDFPFITGIREGIELAETSEDLQKLQKEVHRAYGTYLNAATAKELFERITTRDNHLQSEARAGRTITLEERKLGWEMLKDVVGKQSMVDMDGTQAALRLDTYGRLFFSRVNAGESPSQVSQDLIKRYADQTGRSILDIEGPSHYGSEEAIKQDVDSGKLRPDEGIFELRKFRAARERKERSR